MKNGAGLEWSSGGNERAREAKYRQRIASIWNSETLKSVGNAKTRVAMLWNRSEARGMGIVQR